MELDTERQSKRLIDCVSSSGREDCSNQWFFGALYFDDIDVDFFDNEDRADILDFGEILSWCLAVLNYSPSAALMLGEASDKSWQVAVEDLGGSDYMMDVEEKTIILDSHGLDPAGLGQSHYFRNAMLVTLTKALRDIWQENRHGGFDELYTPEHVILMERVRSADLDVVSVLVAWELRAADYGDMWRHMIGSEAGDMAMIFSGYLERDPSAQFNGQGLVAAFKQWFRETKRLDSCDHDTLEYLDEVLATSDIVNPFGVKKPSKMNVEILSCLPDKSAYLQGQGQEILSNPVYASVDNAINQTHLFHIMYDLEAVIVEDVPFRDVELAQKIFPVTED